MKRYLLVFCILTAVLVTLHQPQLTHAQSDQPAPPATDARFTHLTIEDGLAQSHVTGIVQDPYGFMWFGTFDGLNRYDGYRFIRYSHDPENEQSLSSNNISELLLTDNNILWIATEDAGLNSLNLQTGEISRYQADGASRAGLADDNVQALAADKDGNIWVGLNNGTLDRLNPQDGSITHFEQHTEGPSLGAIRSILIDSLGSFWIGGTGLFSFDPDNGRFLPISLPTPDQDLTALPPPPGVALPAGAGGEPPGPPPQGSAPPRVPLVRDMIEDGDGRIWIGADALYRFYPPTGEIEIGEIPTLGFNIYGLLLDSDGWLWAGDFNATYIYDMETLQIVQRFREEISNPNGFNGGFTESFYESPEGLIWIGTAQKGLNIYDPQQNQFTNFLHAPGKEGSLHNANAHGIAVGPTGIVWIVTGPILNKVDTITKEVTFYDPPRDLGPGSGPEAGGFITIYGDEKGILWLDGTIDLLRFDPKTEETLSFIPEIPNPTTIRDFVPDEAGNLWILTNTAVYAFDLASEQFTVYGGRPNDPASPPPQSTSISIDDKGQIWIGGRGQLSLFDPESQQYQQFRHDPQDPQSMTNGAVTAVASTPKGSIWVASETGLDKLNDDGTFTHLTEKDGLPSSFIRSLLADNQGNLWLGTMRGISQVDPVSGQIINYDQANGLPFQEFINDAAYKDVNGSLYFGGRGGVISFNPDEIQSNPFAPPVTITEMRLFNKPVEPGEESVLSVPIWATDEMTLSHHDNVLSLELAALSYSAPQQNKYRHILAGFEEEWNEVDSQHRIINYTNLDPGAYTLRIQGSNNDGVWSDETTLAITVLPPWWETTWFRLGMLLLLAGLIFGGYRFRVRAMKQRNIQLEQQVSERTEALALSNAQLAEAKENAEAANRAKSTFLANMSHELRSPLNAILGFSQVLDRSPSLKGEEHEMLDIIQRSGEHLLTLINQVLDLSKIEAGQMTLNARRFDLYELLADLENMFRLRAEEKNLHLFLERLDDVPQYIRTDQVKLRQVLINLLNNALKFTEEGGVAVRIGGHTAVVDDKVRLRFEVEDTGPGIAAAEMGGLFEAFVQTEVGRDSQEGTGLGLPISREFVRLMGGDMTVRSTVGKGTAFRFEIQAEVVDSPRRPRQENRQRVVGLADGQPVYRLLVVDDIAANRHLVLRLLEPVGFEMREAANGEEAIAIWQDWQPDLIWMDMRMPVLNGYEATKQIKATAQGQETVVVALTASSFEEERGQIMAVGCDAYLQKPFRESDIFDLLAETLNVTYTYDTVAPDSPETAVSIQENAQILVVEDNPTYQQLAIRLLNQLDQVADVAENGRQAIALVEQRPYPLILMDMQMPEISGLETSKRIRKLVNGREAAIIALSANALDEISLTANGIVFDDFITKPVRLDTLQSMIEAHLLNGHEPEADQGAASPAQEETVVLDMSALTDIKKAVGEDTAVFNSILDSFLIDARDCLSDMQESIDSDDGERLYRAAHTLKSLAGNFGAPKLADTCRTLEKQTHKQGTKDAGKLAAEAKTAFQAYRTALAEQAK